MLFAVGAAAAACISACGGTGVTLPSDCIINRGVRDFDVLDNQNLIIYGPGHRGYHVVLVTPSINIRGEIAIGIVDGDEDGRICSFGRDMILVDGPLREQMSIRSIEAVDGADVEALKVQFGLIESADDAVTVTEIE
jgi:hypothetical protein